MIQCSGLSKDFKISTKTPGFKGTMASFFKREYVVKSAVKDFDSPNLIGLLGPNGSGKTTVMKRLTGIIVPSQGQLKVFNQKSSDRKNSFKKNISLVMD